MIRTAGNQFDPGEGYAYFIASNVDRMRWGQACHTHLLIAVNELKTEADLTVVESWLDAGRKVFVDSGIFNLTNEHARKHNVRMDEALALAPEEIDGFDELLTKYRATLARFGDRVWGYIELDQGGRENKIKTRAMLEAVGLRPVPVYHPLNDGWDYFDELAGRYDRICFGNIVQASRPDRLRLIATAWERRQKYPELWIHLLGFTPSEWLIAFPVNSGDSSSWLSAVQWSGYKPRTCCAAFGSLPAAYQYELGSDPTGASGNQKATRMSAHGVYIHQRNWQAVVGAYAEAGFDPRGTA